MLDVTPLDTHLTPPKHPHMTITNFNYEGSYLPGVICNIVVKAHLGNLPPPPADLPVDLNGNFGCLPLELISADHQADLPPLQYICQLI